MTIVFESVIDYLEKCGLIKTARVMRKELKASKDIILDSDKEMHLLSKNLLFLARKLTFNLRIDAGGYHQEGERTLED